MVSYRQVEPEKYAARKKYGKIVRKKEMLKFSNEIKLPNQFGLMGFSGPRNISPQFFA